MRIRSSAEGSGGRAGDVAFWVILVAVFAGARVYYTAKGVDFRFDTVYFFSQILDPPLLQERLAESLWYLHSQPPVFNLLTGVVMKAFPDSFPVVFNAVFVVTGLATTVFAAKSLRGMGLPKWFALAAALAFACAPPFVIYENWYFYPHLCMCLLTIAAWMLLRSGGRKAGWITGAMWLLALLVMTRSLFHPLFLLAAAVSAVFLVGRGARRAVMIGAVGPVAVVLLLCLKNLWLFGFFGTSSWGGNSLHRVARDGVAEKEVRRLVDEGVLSPISTTWEFSHPSVYVDLLGLDPTDTGVPALDRMDRTPHSPVTKRDPINYNHWSNLDASRAYMRDAVELARRYPGELWTTVESNFDRFVSPVTRETFVVENRNRVNVLATEVERLERGVLMPVVVPLLLVFSLSGLARSWRRDPGRSLALVFCFATIAWVTALGTLAETGENSRFRYQIMSLVLLACCHGGATLASDAVVVARWFKARYEKWADRN